MGKHDKVSRALTNRKDKKLGPSTFKLYPFKLSDSVKGKVQAGQADALKRWHLDFRAEAIPGARTGDKVLNTKTIAANEFHLKNVEKFCWLIGDYESSIILNLRRPDFSPSMSVETIVLYLRYKFHRETYVLKDLSGNNVKDVDGNVIMCTGTWNDPGNAEHFRAAINALHEARGVENRGLYLEVCKACQALSESNRHKGCKNHSGQSQFNRKGNPTTDPSFKNALMQVKKDGESYKIHGCDQLMPGEVRQLGNYLRSTNSLKDLQTLVVILLSIKTFLRADDLEIKVEDIETDTLCMVNETGLHNLCFTVLGKSDKELIYLSLWKDDDCPDFCALRALLVYVFLTGIKEGPLFVTEVELKAMPANGVTTTQISYGSIMTRLEFLFKAILKNTDKNLGSHTLRKTAYLFANFGHAPLTDMMLAARHKNVANALKYEKGCSHARKCLEVQPDPLQRVSEFTPVRCMDPKAQTLLNAKNRVYFKSLPQLASDFVHVQLKVSIDDPKLYHPSYLMEKALAWKRDDDALGTFNKLLDKFNITTLESRALFLQAVERISEERLRALNPAAGKDKNSTCTMVDKTDIEMEEELGYTSRKRGTGLEDLEGRLEVARATCTQDKINILLRLQQVASKNPEKNLTSGALTFYKKYIKKVKTCLDCHFTINNNIDVAAFCTKYPDYSHTKWSCCCKV